MKILHVIPAIALSYGGPSQAVLEMGRALLKEGVEIEIVTTSANSNQDLNVPYGKKIEYEGIPTRFFPRTLNEYKFSWPFTQWLKTNIKNYNLLHIHSIFCFPTACAAHYARKYQIPYIIRPAGMLDDWSMKQKGWRKKIYFQIVEKKSLENAIAIHYTSEAEKNAAEKLPFFTRGIVIPLSVAIDIRFQTLEQGTFRKKYSEYAGKKIVTFLSRLDPKKGLKLLLEALSRLGRRRNDFVLLIAGKGKRDYEHQVRKWTRELHLESQTFFLGFLDSERKYELLRDTDLFVLPSHQENFGLAVVEAMQMGVPVVVSDQIDLSQEIESRGAGRVVPLDSHRLALAIEALLEDEEERTRLGENGRRLALEKFSREQMVHGLIGLYRSILENKGSVRCIPNASR